MRRTKREQRQARAARQRPKRQHEALLRKRHRAKGEPSQPRERTPDPVPAAVMRNLLAGASRQAKVRVKT